MNWGGNESVLSYASNNKCSDIKTEEPKKPTDIEN